MRKTLKISTLSLLILLSIFTFLACSKEAKGYNLAKKESGYSRGDFEDAIEVAAEDVQTAYGAGENSSLDLKELEQKLIKNAYIRFETENLEQTTQNINVALKQAKGYLANENTENFHSRKSKHLVVRVPVQNFDSFLEQISKGVKKFDRKEISVSDVTSEFIDLQARLKVKKETEARYIELLKRANSVKEILEIEKEMQNIRCEIDSIEGQFKYLNNQIDYSTFDIYFYTNIKTATNFGYDLKQALKAGGRNVYFGILGLVGAWPILIILAIIIFVVVRFIKKRKKA